MWHGLQLLAPVAEGHRNEVWRARLAGEFVSVRRSARSAPSLDWELDTLEAVAARDIGVPAVIRSDDGRRSVDGVVVQGWIDGRPPADGADWQRVADALAGVHSVVVDQRPGACAVTDLGRTGCSVDADLSAVPDEVADVVLAVFASVADAPVSLIHGDPGPSNLLLDDAGRVWLLDWDESRVDVTWHDLSNLGIRVLPDDRHRRALALSHAWEAVNAWTVEPDYARRRYDALLRLTG